MKFRFCGEADCPDWILTQINVLSRISSIKLKSLTQIVAKGIMEPPVNMTNAEKLFSDSKLDSDVDLKTCMACISFLLTSAIQYNCNSTALQSELQQLGLPREHSTSIKRIVDEQSVDLTKYFRTKTFRVNRLEEATTDVDRNKNYVTLELLTNGSWVKVIVTPNLLHNLIKDFKAAYSKMTQLNDNASIFS